MVDYIWYNVFDHSCLCAHDLCNFKKEQMWICTVSTEPCRSPFPPPPQDPKTPVKSTFASQHCTQCADYGNISTSVVIYIII